MSVVRCLAGGSSLSLAMDNKEHQFNFDKVFAPGTQQQQVSDSCCASGRCGCLRCCAYCLRAEALMHKA
jgi:hypothetical protein